MAQEILKKKETICKYGSGAQIASMAGSPTQSIRKRIHLRTTPTTCFYHPQPQQVGGGISAYPDSATNGSAQLKAIQRMGGIF
jgi:hypothetical protein